MEYYKMEFCYHSTVASIVDSNFNESVYIFVGDTPPEVPPDAQITTLLLNPQLPFWRRAVREFDELSQENTLHTFDRIAPIISDLGQSLYMLFGRNWESNLKTRWKQVKGDPPSTSNTPSLMPFVEVYYPETAGWNLKNDDEHLFNELKDFVQNKYENLVKHFEEELLGEAISITFDQLRSYMEIVRRTWIWFIEKHTGMIYNENDPAFEDFNSSY